MQSKYRVALRPWFARLPQMATLWFLISLAHATHGAPHPQQTAQRGPSPTQEPGFHGLIHVPGPITYTATLVVPDGLAALKSDLTPGQQGPFQTVQDFPQNEELKMCFKACIDSKPNHRASTSTSRAQAALEGSIGGGTTVVMIVILVLWCARRRRHK